MRPRDAFLQQLVLGLLLGGLYGLAAAGLSLVFGVLRGAQRGARRADHAGRLREPSALVTREARSVRRALLIIPLAGAALGALLYGGLFRFMVRPGEEARIKNSLLVGFGLALTLQALAVRLFTADERSITTSYAAGRRVGGRGGPARAAPEPRRRASSDRRLLHALPPADPLGSGDSGHRRGLGGRSLLGIDVRRAYPLAFALGTALAGTAGTLVSRGLLDQPVHRAGLDPEGAHRRGAGRPGSASAPLGRASCSVAEAVAPCLRGALPRGGRAAPLLLVLGARPQGLFGRP